MKMICFPHAGGMSGYYSFLEKAKITGISDIIVYDYPGRGKVISDTDYECFQDCIDDMCKKIIALDVVNKEFVLFGHSMGAYVAYETACKLQKDYNLYPFYIILSGQKPPCNASPKHYKMCANNGMNFLKALGGVPDIIFQNKEFAQYFLDICVSDLKILQSYEPHMPDAHNRPFCGSIICGDNDLEVSIEELKGWEDYFEVKPSINIVSGTHFYFQNAHNKLIDFMNAELKKAIELRNIK